MQWEFRKERFVLSKVYVVGIGPGAYEDMTIRAVKTLEKCDIIVGYQTYVNLVKEHFQGKEFFTTPMKKEAERCMLALEHSLRGKRVAMISSGDAGIYGMAGLMYEVAEKMLREGKAGERLLTDEEKDILKGLDIQVIPGITAASSGAAILGAPLIHDFAIISLSDLMTPWKKIEARLACAAKADLGIVLYNPSSHKRADYLQKACDILLQTLPPDRICGIVENIGREGEKSRILTLSELRNTQVNMFTTVFVGNQQTKVLRQHMVTPRGYREVKDSI